MFENIVKTYPFGEMVHNGKWTDPKALHGPYYEWTRKGKVRGKTVSVRLKKKEAEQLMEWIENKRRFYEIISKMEKITLEAVNLIRV